MRISITTVAAMIVIALTPAVAGAERPDYCARYPALNTAKGAKQRAEKGWNAEKYKTSAAAQRRVRIQSHCAPTNKGRRHVKQAIAEARAAYKTSSIDALYEKLTNPPGQEWLYAVRVCESSDRYEISPGGAYGMLQGWAATTGWYEDSGWPEPAASTPPEASPEQQDIRASLLYQHYGGGPWPNCP